MPVAATTIGLLVLSNLFMTFAWYGHLKYKTAPLWIAVGTSWLIAFVEYCFQVPLPKGPLEAGPFRSCAGR